jgi:hypothetical protein
MPEDALLFRLFNVPYCRSQWLRGLRPLACWDCGFESHRWHGCLTLANVVCCHVEISATGRSLVQRNPTEYGVSVIWNLDNETA